MQARSWWRYGMWVMLLIAVLSSAIYRSWHRTLPQSAPINCGNLQQPCNISAYGKTVLIQFSRPASGLHPFMLRVMTDNAHKIIATMSMRDMDMGENRYLLQHTTAHQWQTQIILPVCASGSRNWLLRLTIDGKTVNIPFSD